MSVLILLLSLSEKVISGIWGFTMDVSRIEIHEYKAYTSTRQPLHSSLWRVEGSRTRCLACVRHCLLPESGVGYCTAIVNEEGTLYSTAYGVIGECSVTPIENRPVYHYRPGTRTLCL